MGTAGDSAGANLATVIAMMSRDKNGPEIMAQALIYPATNLSSMDTESYRNFAEGFFLTRAKMERFRDVYTPNPADRLNPYVSPLLAQDLSGLPPALIITDEFDPLRDDGEAYAQHLKEAGVETIVTRYDGMVHGFVAVERFLPQAQEATRQVGEFFKKQLQ